MLRVLLITVPPLRRVTFSKRRKSNQKGFPQRTALRRGSVFPRYGAHPGASPTVCFAAPPLDVCGFAAWRYAPPPRMDTFARPAEGAEDQKPDQEPKPKPKPKPKQIKRSQPSAAPTGDWVYSDRNWSLSGRLRWQASSHSGIGCFQLEIGRLSGRHRWQASSHKSHSRPHPLFTTQHDER